MDDDDSLQKLTNERQKSQSTNNNNRCPYHVYEPNYIYCAEKR